MKEKIKRMLITIKDSVIFKSCCLIVGAILPLLVEKYVYPGIGFSYERAIISLLIFEFCFLHFIIKPQKIWDFMYRFRYLIGILIFSLLVAFGFHGSSIGLYNYYIEPETILSDSEPIVSKNRPIRSDEWMVSSTFVLSQAAKQNNFSEVSHTVMGVNSRVNFYPKLPTKSLASLSSPGYLGFLFLPKEQAFSFMWFLPYFLTFFAAFEFFMLILKKNKLWSLTGSLMLTLAPAVQWWDTSTYIYSGMFAVVFFDKFLNSKTIVNKLIFSVLIGWFCAIFAGSLYPAWMVPYGYFYLGIVVWMLVTNKKKYKLLDIICLGAIVILVVGALIIPPILESKSIIDITSNTVYPAARLPQGGQGWNYLFNYLFSPLLSFFPFNNPCEYSQFLSFFPIPLLIGINMILKNRKEKKKDLLLYILIIIPCLLLIWNFVPLPEILIKLSLLSFSTEKRSVLIVGFMFCVLLVYCLANYREQITDNRFNRLFIALFVTLFGAYTVAINYFEFSIKRQNVAIIIFTVIIYMMLNNNKKNNKKIAYLLVALSILSGAFVHPLVRGLDVIYKKPVAYKIQNIVKKDPDSRWASVNAFLAVGNYTLANGAKVINSTNYYPNLKVWNVIDKNKKYEDVWNRYAHMAITLTQDKTSVTLPGLDTISLNLNSEDACKLKIDYIISYDSDLERYSTAKVDFESIYENQNMFIYKVNCD